MAYLPKYRAQKREIYMRKKERKIGLTFGPLAEIVTGSLVQHAGDLPLHELGVLQVGHQYQVLP